jgi:hypothetical protein
MGWELFVQKPEFDLQLHGDMLSRFDNLVYEVSFCLGKILV